MRKKIIACLMAAALMLSLLPSAFAADEDPVMKIGLYFSTAALPSANLANEVGSGYRFGYFDGNRDFVQLGQTSQDKISMLKDQTMYYSGGTYYDTAVSSYTIKIGCYHIDSGQVYSSFSEAQAYADTMTEGGWPSYPAYVGGQYRVRIEYFSSEQYALAGLSVLGIAGASVVYPSSSCITVVQTTTGKLLFAYDSGSNTSGFAVMPSLGEVDKPETWFKGYTYYGGFEYVRRNGNDMTVVNYVRLHDYIKGVIPYEMSPSWPVEALKAQALCAKTFALANKNKYNSAYGFDLTNTTSSQVYRGTNTATANSDRAVDEIYGLSIQYSGKYIDAVYHSSSGGATENSENVWQSAVPYLKAVTDNFEDVTNNPRSSWSSTLTTQNFTTILNEKGYNAGTIVDAYVEQYTAAGNVYKLTFINSAGNKYFFIKQDARTIMNNTSVASTLAYSQRFTLSNSVSLYAKGDRATTYMSSLSGVYAIGSGKSIKQLSGSTSSIYILSGSGKTALSSDSSKYVLTGKGWGHNVGMSQYGALGMATLGYDYEDIIKHYYTGVTISTIN